MMAKGRNLLSRPPVVLRPVLLAAILLVLVGVVERLIALVNAIGWGGTDT